MAIKYIENSYIKVRYLEGKGGTHLDKLEISKEYRNQGYGTRFMKQFIEEVKKPITVLILTDKPLNFYLKLGFEIVDSRYNAGELTQASLIYKGVIR